MNEGLIEKFKRVAIIDHHRSGDEGFVDTVFSYVEPYASSTVELVSEMLNFYQRERIDVPAFEATIMLAGIVVDTNNFTYRTRTRTFEAASTLNTRGADMVLVRKLLRDSYEEERRIASAMVNVEIFEKRFAIVAQSEDEIVPDRTTLAKISDKLLTIDGIETGFSIGRLPDGLVAISARSMDAVNVQIIMEELQGGGHFNAAATQLKDTTIEEAKDMLIQILRRDFVETGDETMKVILIADVKNVGKKGDVVEITRYLNKSSKGQADELAQECLGDAFEMVEKLAEATGKSCPEQLANLRDKAVRFDGCCSKDSMDGVVFDMLGI
jgi:c-di-AMP phosphodiesterase-like protein